MARLADGVPGGPVRARGLLPQARGARRTLPYVGARVGALRGRRGPAAVPGGRGAGRSGRPGLRGPGRRPRRAGDRGARRAPRTCGRTRACPRRRARRPSRRARSPRRVGVREPRRGSPDCCSPTSGWTTCPCRSPRWTRQASRGSSSYGRTAPNGSGSPSPARRPRGSPGGGRRRPRRDCGPRSASPGTRPGRPPSPPSSRGSRSPSTTRTPATPAPVRHAHRLPRGARDGTRTGRLVRHHRARRPGRLRERDGRRSGGRTPRRTPAHPARRPARPRRHGRAPPLALASTDPTAYVRALASAGEAAELTAPGGLGDFAWARAAGRNPGPARRALNSPYLSMSPTTKNNDPRIATMSATSVPGSSTASAWMLL